MNEDNKIYRKSRVLYIISAALEYFISILTGTAYLAKIAGSIGISDGTIGVLSSFTALGCAFQIVSLTIRTDKPVKPRVLTINLINQLCFTLLYVTPVLNLPKNIKTGLFTALLLIGNILLNIPFSLKATWSKSLVDEKKRGIFAANCEITSLVSGMIFTMLAGRLIDTFEEMGNQIGAFTVCSVVLLILTVSHALCILFIREDKLLSSHNEPLGVRLKSAMTDRSTLLLLPLFVLWNAAQYLTIPFFGTYQINDLGFTMTAISLISAGYAIIRGLASAPLGMLGDKRSFISSMSVSLAAMALGLLINSIGGKICHIIFYALYGVALAGMNSGIMNIIFDYVPREKRNGAVSILYTIGGLIGFCSTLIAKPLVDYVQSSGNSFLFIEHIYAQQILSVIGAALTLAT
ncbi:MAG: MFS transporter, partial [Clostridia bacterium]|nr:MFS transporter [Clostridia bacterium]